MKFLLAVLVTFSQLTMADTFYSTKEFTSQSNDDSFKFPKAIEVNIKSVNFSKDEATILYGDKVVTIPLTIVAKDITRQSLNVDYKGIVETQTMKNISYCDEYEKVEFHIEFNYEKPYVAHDPIETTITKFYAVQVYKYDICHDPQPEVTVYEFLKK